MPTREEIVEWLEEAEAVLKDYESLLEESGRQIESHDIQCLHKDFEYRTVQVADMCCETCNRQQAYLISNRLISSLKCQWSGSGGCFHHEPKDKG